MLDKSNLSWVPFNVGQPWRAALANVINEVEGTRRHRADTLDNYLAWYTEQGGRADILMLGDRPVAYITLSPLPGLPGIFMLEGGVGSAYRRQRIATSYLPSWLAGLAQEEIIDVSLPSGDWRGALLAKHGFLLNHTEVQLTHSLHNLPPQRNNDAFEIRTLPTADAINTFIQLYDRSFAPHPWYQPYTYSEVAHRLNQSGDLRFLFTADEPIGVAWLQKSSSGVELEPIGVVPQWQGRGAGRYLLTAILHECGAKNKASLELGAHESNQAALQLYESAGFELKGRTELWRWTGSDSKASEPL